MIKGDIKTLLRESVIRRLKDGAIPSARRLVNAENDFLPGFTADYYEGWIVCQATSAFAERYKKDLADELFNAVPGCKGVAERLDADARKLEGLEYFSTEDEKSFNVLVGEAPPETIQIVENGVKFLVDVRKGHKTGFYLDQRNARELVGKLSQGRDVLNCFSYTGGFGIYAAMGGAKSVTQVDVSADALGIAAKNAELNNVETELVKEDVFSYLRKCRDARKTFDLIVLDPPKFADSKSGLMKAARGYKDINLLAMKLIRPGGIIATFSCSGAMTSEFFDTILQEAAQDAQKDFQVIARTGHADDHPVSLAFPEGAYLKGVFLQA
jgi:23S rRNA (cytosine1962-C5)-methyltransferase